MVVRTLKYLIFIFLFVFAHNTSKLIENTLPTSKKLSYSPLGTTTLISTYMSVSSNFTTSILSLLAQNVTTTNSPIVSPQVHNMKEALRKGIEYYSENSPEVYCKFQPNGFDCDESGIFIPKFYYDIKMETCKTFNFGQCKVDLNRFDTLPDCHNTCLEAGKRELTGQLSANIYCKLQPDFGKCNDYHPMWYYDVSNQDCRGFSYSGCGGNLNRFTSHQLCVALCNNLRD